MNPFVDPSQRGFELPEGCNDLIDVLRKATRPQPPRPASRGSESFADIENYISRVLESSANRCSLTIYCWQHEDKHLLSLGRVKTGVLHAVILVKCANAPREETVRAIFAENGIAPAHDILAGESGDQSRFLWYPLPATAKEAAKLITNLLQRAYGLPADAGLVINLHQKDEA
jgi:hypothetical protein